MTIVTDVWFRMCSCPGHVVDVFGSTRTPGGGPFPVPPKRANRCLNATDSGNNAVPVGETELPGALGLVSMVAQWWLTHEIGTIGSMW